MTTHYVNDTDASMTWFLPGPPKKTAPKRRFSSHAMTFKAPSRRQPRRRYAPDPFAIALLTGRGWFRRRVRSAAPREDPTGRYSRRDIAGWRDRPTSYSDRRPEPD